MDSDLDYMDARHLRGAEDVDGWVRYAIRLGVNAALYPLEYSKTLIKIGYEPIPPRLGKSFFGKPRLVLPNLFQYAAHIRRVDGIAGCYRGLLPKLMGNLVSTIASEKLVQKLNLEPMEDKDVSNRTLDDNELYIHYIYNLKRDVVLCVSGIIVSHPFRVMSTRMMAQFIGREEIYQSFITSVVEIWKTQGIRGFFSGLIPQLICDVACLVLTSTTVYLISKYATKDRVIRQYSNGIVQFIYTSILYPFEVISTCMTVSGSRLVAGTPPFMPLYGSWVSCYFDLHSRRELTRGSSILWRSTRMLPRSPSEISSKSPLLKSPLIKSINY